MKGNIENFKSEIFNKIELTFENYNNDFQNVIGNIPNKQEEINNSIIQQNLNVPKY